MQELELAEKYCIFKCRAGSHAYGTSSAHSDIDTRGIFIAPPEYLGPLKGVEQVEVPGEDTVIYELAKFIKLATECNPNIIELLFTDEENCLFEDQAFTQLRAQRHLFLSKKAKHTFSGYAMAQMKRIRGHHRWLNNPQPERAPQLLDFATFIDTKGKVSKLPDEFLTETFLVKVNATTFRVFSSPIFTKPVVSEDGVNIQFVDMSEERLQQSWEQLEFLGILIVQSETYKVQHRIWKEYWNWKRKRNPARAALEEQHGFDCYSDDTEFLTEFGWQNFDDVLPETAVATLNPETFQVEYQKPVERHEASYSGRMVRFTGHHTDINVSANHRMFLNKVERKSKKEHGWEFTQACMVPDTFLIVNRINPIRWSSYPKIPNGIDMRLYLKIMGWYVSEGSVAHWLSSGKPSVLSISQLQGGRLHWRINRAIKHFPNQVKINVYSHFRESKNRIEMTWTIPNRELAQNIVSQCGDKSENKRLPRWVMSLSRRMKEILLNALHAGDGTDARPHDAQVYYTSSSQLADDVQELAFLCGFETAKWGLYENDGCGMYHVHINKKAEPFRTLIRSQNVEKKEVWNQRIVCFTVPNEILITRRNGKIGIQGNTKHAMHLMRLLRMAHEILREGEVIVRRPDADELKAIRNGSFNYEQLVAEAERMDAELEGLYETSALPHSANKEAINTLFLSICQDFWRRHKLI